MRYTTLYKVYRKRKS